MNILVTGGAGYIGSILVPLLIGHGHRVRTVDNLMYSGQSLLGVWSHPGFEFIRADISDSKAIEAALEGMDAVVHLAAIVGDPACARQSDLARKVNLDASLQLFELSRRHGVGRFVFSSTCSNYGRVVDPSAYVTEESEVRPVSLYAETKVAVENALLGKAEDNGTAVTVLRFATIFGLAPRLRFDLTVNEFTAQLFTSRKLVVYGEQFWRPYIHVRDAARAVTMVLDAPPEKIGGQVFNVGCTQENYQKARLVDLICAQIGGETQIQHVDKQDDPRSYRVSFEKIAATLGFRVTRTVADGIREVIEALSTGVITDYDQPCYRN